MSRSPRSWLRFDRAKGNSGLLVAQVLNAFGAGLFYPFALLYFTTATDLSAASVGLILTFATLISLPVTPVTGILVDTFGAKRFVVLSQCLEATGFTLYAGVSTSTSLIAAAILTTAGTRMYYASLSAFIAEISAPESRDQWYGFVGVVQSLAGTVSGALVAVLVSATGTGSFRPFVVGTAACLGLCAVFYARQRDSNRRHEALGRLAGGFGDVLWDRAYMGMVGANGLLMLSTLMASLGLSVYATQTLHAPLWVIGAIGMLQTTLVVTLQGRMLVRLQHRRRSQIMIGASVLWVWSFLGYAVAPQIPAFLIVPFLALIAFLMIFAQMAYAPTARSLAAGAGRPGVEGRYIAVFELSWGAASAGAPGLFGLLFDWQPVIPWLAMAAMSAIAVWLLRWSGSRLAPEADRSGGAVAA